MLVRVLTYPTLPPVHSNTMSSRTTEIDLKANKLYYKLSEDEKKWVLAMPLGQFRLHLDRFNKAGKSMVDWIRYQCLNKSNPRGLVVEDLKETDLAQAVLSLQMEKQKRLDQIVEDHKNFIHLLPDDILDFNLRSIPKSCLEPGLTYQDLSEHIRDLRRRGVITSIVRRYFVDPSYRG
jgi:hypothetical protein